MEEKVSNHKSGLLVFILTLGVFGILNTEMGVIGMLPLIAETFGVTVPQAGWTVTVFALVIAISGPVTPMLFSRFDRKFIMLLSLGIFIVSNIASMLTESFAVLLIARAIPAFFHPVYVSMAFTVAASSVEKKDAPKAVSRVFIGVSAGMVLGVPIASFIASETSYAMAMLFFAGVNALVFVATIFCVPSMPVSGRLGYGEQLQVLKKPVLWWSIAAVIFMNGAMFGFFSYLSDVLKTVTVLPFSIISIVLFLYGGANIVGNVIAGRLLVKDASATLKLAPMVMIAPFLLLLAMSDQFMPMVGIVLFLGVVTGWANINSQYMVSSVTAEAPDFGNGVFLTAANLGTALGTLVCGMFISGMGTQHAVIGAMLCLAGGIAAILVRSRILSCSLSGRATIPVEATAV